MIRYALKCAEGHSFESWFQSADAYEALASKGLVSCAVCGGAEVTKALMAPRVSAAEGAADGPVAAHDRPLSAPAHPAEQMLRALREHLKTTSTYVGGRFAQEARAMHLGETDERPIHGEASPAEARALIEEGVPIAPLPILPPDKTN
ncbi:DUF1178 family protein [Rhodobacterales bacterium HKCCSP123]|nr:DUF1178 family protein [Rhodobacterales bacterium HKCCSP123]